jgi:hypothetical protein
LLPALGFSSKIPTEIKIKWAAGYDPTAHATGALIFIFDN